MSSVKIFRPWTAVLSDPHSSQLSQSPFTPQHATTPSNLPEITDMIVSSSSADDTNTTSSNSKPLKEYSERVPQSGASATSFLMDTSASSSLAWNGLTMVPPSVARIPVDLPPTSMTSCYEDWIFASSAYYGFPPAGLVNQYAMESPFMDPASAAYLNMALGDLQHNVTSTSADQTANTNKLKQRPKKFRCPHCKVSFSNNGQLKGHVRIHTGERPFKCDAEKCGKSFTRNEELTRHKRIHTGLRPYPCDHCGKRFGRKDHLKKHVRTHFPQPRYMDPALYSLYPVLFGY